jgi:hypothetical protein
VGGVRGEERLNHCFFCNVSLGCGLLPPPFGGAATPAGGRNKQHNHNRIYMFNRLAGLLG